jgi:putative endonuclease
LLDIFHSSNRVPKEPEISPPRRNTRVLGRRGEDIAKSFLEHKGFRILARNVHLRHAEPDLIALDDDTLCFVEVRLRGSERFGTAEASVDARKQRRMARAASEVLATRRLPRFRKVRFDVLAIDAWLEPPRVRHIRDAFHL